MAQLLPLGSKRDSEASGRVRGIAPDRSSSIERESHVYAQGAWPADYRAVLGASAELDADKHHGHEFFIGVAQDLEGVDRRLASLAGYRYDTGIELGPGQSVPSDHALWPDTEMSALLVMRPREPIIPDLVLDDGRHAVFLQAIPLYRSELAYKMRRGADELIDEFERLQVPFWDATRPCCPLN